MNEIVIGSTIEALLFAYLNNLKIYYNVFEPPYWWLETPIHLDLERHYLPYFEDYSVFYNYLHSILSLSGNIPFGKSELIKFENNTLTIDSENVDYDKAYIFSQNSIEGLPEQIKTPTKQLVTDYFNLRYSSPDTRIGWYKTKGKLAHDFLFYKMPKMNGLKCVALSILTDKELDSEEYSLDSSRFKLYNHCIEQNIHGGYMNNLKGKVRYHRLDFYPKIRWIENQTKPTFEDTERLICSTGWKIEEVLSQELILNNTAEMSSRFRKYNKIY